MAQLKRLISQILLVTVELFPCENISLCILNELETDEATWTHSDTLVNPRKLVRIEEHA